MNKKIYNFLTEQLIDQEHKAILDEAIELESKLLEFNKKVCRKYYGHNKPEAVYVRYIKIEDYFNFIESKICEILI